ncbi:hypothetical protein [Dialister sp.]|uniref:hypothetical protein n=1 Tax=Dialister sp. TaxID=1955814 RepID=UPI002E801876|nr:hypothetical protein [Dialister sp.]MEE3453908.1 hypothetical protein [Dialister sp.]
MSFLKRGGSEVSYDGLMPEEIQGPNDPEPEIYPVGTVLYFVDVERDGKIEKNVGVTKEELESLLAEGRIR